jgi:hypothetical protein
MVMTVLWGAVLGAIAGCLPAATAYGSFWGSGDGQFGMWIQFLVIANAPLALVAGVSGGIMYGVNQRFPTAASPCVGIVAGGIVSVIFNLMAIGPWYLIFVTPVVGVVLGSFVALLTWRRVVPPIPSPQSQDER